MKKPTREEIIKMGPKPDLSGMDLSDLDLSGLDLTDANLTDAKLTSSTLTFSLFNDYDLFGTEDPFSAEFIGV